MQGFEITVRQAKRKQEGEHTRGRKVRILCNERGGNLQDSEAGIARAVEATPEDQSQRAARLHHLANHLNNQYKRTGDLPGLEATIAQQEAAVEATSENDPDRATRLSDLGGRLSSKYERSGNLQDLEASITRSEAALEATPEDHPDRAIRLLNLSVCLSSRYERSGNL